MSDGGYYLIGGLHRPDQIGGFPVAIARLYGIFNTVTRLTNKSAPKITYMGVAAGDPQTNENALRENLNTNFPRGDYSNESHFVSLTNESSPESITDAFKSADIVYMDGGPNNQNLEQLITSNNMIKLFSDMVKRGGLVGGQSAGANILTHTHSAWVGDKAETRQGLAIIPELAFAAHIDDINQREQRLEIITRAQKENPTQLDKCWGVASGFALLSKPDQDKPQIVLPEGWGTASHDHSDAELAAVINGKWIYAAPETP